MKKIYISAKTGIQVIGLFIVGISILTYGAFPYNDSNNPLYLVFVIAGGIILTRYVLFCKAARLHFYYSIIVQRINLLHKKDELPKGLETIAKIKRVSISDLQQIYSKRYQFMQIRAFESAERNLESIVKLDPNFPYLKELREELSCFSIKQSKK